MKTTTLTKHILIFTLLSSVYSCQKKEGLQLKKIGQQVFETEFIPSPTFSGYYMDSKTGIEYLYLSNGRTDKKVSFFTLNGELIKTIDFKNATRGHRLDDISIWSMDTILALSTGKGIVSAINGSGHLIRRFDVNKLLPDSSPGTYMMSSTDDDFLYKKDIYLYRGHKSPVNPQKTYLHHLIKSNNLKRNLPYFIKVENIFSETPVLTFLVDSFYANFIPKNHDISDLPSYSFLNSCIQIISFKIDCLFIYDLEGKHIATTYLDYQNKVDQSLKQYELKEGYETSMQKYDFWSTLNASIATKVYFDNKKQRYYVVALHAYEGPDEDSWDKRHWSMLVYDKNFKPIDEIIVTDPEIRSGVLYLTSKGWYARKNKKYIENYDPHKTYFDIYTIE